MIGKSLRRKSHSKIASRAKPLRYEALEFRRVLTICQPTYAGLYDFGDLPDTGYGTGHNNYLTFGYNHGAVHAITGPRLGDNRDQENKAQPDPDALGDDDCHNSGENFDDEDGITFPSAMTRHPFLDTTGSFDLDLQNADSSSNKLDAWIDFNKDGDFTDTDEQIFDTYSLGTTDQVISLNFTIPGGFDNYPDDHYFGRFRLSTQGGLSPQFFFWDGEVEDHAIPIGDSSSSSLVAGPEMLESQYATSGSDLVSESEGITSTQAPLANSESIIVNDTSFTKDNVALHSVERDNSADDNLVEGKENELLDADDDYLYLASGIEEANGGDSIDSGATQVAATDEIFGNADDDLVTGEVDSLDTLALINTNEQA